MTGALVPLDAVPALIQRERSALAAISDPASMADAERRAAAIADLTKRAGLAVPIQNEATFLRAEALERLAVLVDASPKNPGNRFGSGGSDSAPPYADLGIRKERISEGRALAATGALAKVKAEAERHPDRPVSMDQILKQAKRSQREQRLRQQRDQATAEAKRSPRSSSVTTADIRDWRPAGVHAIVTDPPYITPDAVELYGALADFAVDVLPDHGALATLCWQPILERVMFAMQRPELAFRWVICWQFDGGDHNARTFDMARRVHDGWKPVLIYHKHGWTNESPSLYDIIRSPGRVPNNDHIWEQGVEGIESLIRYTSVAGDLICDPFCGSGTTGIAALKNDRDFVGADIDDSHIATARERLAA